MLPAYVEVFDTVELNNSFYHLPKEETFEGWYNKTPEHFLFSVKGSRFITHIKKLNNVKESLDLFFERAEGLKEKLGPVLFQLPPKWQQDLELLEEFLMLLPKKKEVTIEFRDHSWHTPEVIVLLKKYNVAFCIYHLAGFESPREITADFTYVRLHGPNRSKYSGSYSDEALQNWAKQILSWKNTLKHIYVYFDNDISAFAPKNAQALKQLLNPYL